MPKIRLSFWHWIFRLLPYDVIPPTILYRTYRQIYTWKIDSHRPGWIKYLHWIHLHFARIAWNTAIGDFNNSKRDVLLLFLFLRCSFGVFFFVCVPLSFAYALRFPCWTLFCASHNRVWLATDPIHIKLVQVLGKLRMPLRKRLALQQVCMCTLCVCQRWAWNFMSKTPFNHKCRRQNQCATTTTAKQLVLVIHGVCVCVSVGGWILSLMWKGSNESIFTQHSFLFFSLVSCDSAVPFLNSSSFALVRERCYTFQLPH